MELKNFHPGVFFSSPRNFRKASQVFGTEKTVESFILNAVDWGLLRIFHAGQALHTLFESFFFLRLRYLDVPGS